MRTWAPFLLGLAAVYGLFEWSASRLGSTRGESGLLVAALVVGATLAVASAVFRRPLVATAMGIGLGRPRLRGVLVAAGICVLILCVVPLFALATGTTAATDPAAPSLLPGLFAQGGIAEETLFRGYLFGHLRKGRTFWRAAILAMLPFVAVHLLLFATMPAAIAAAALTLAVVLSFPLAHLFELGGATIWPSALLHFVIQATVKVVTFTGEGAAAFPLVWMLAAAVIPFAAFVVPRPATAR